MQGHAGAAALLQDLLESPDPVGVSAITVMQLYHGVSRAAVPEAEAEKIERALKGVATYDVTREVAGRAGRLDGELVTRGEALDPADVIIGVTALHRNEPLVTRNVRHFSRLKGLRILSY
ncbi:MAG: type II toxin-antitoxin system VapC family toxin [Methanobacteriota archaeon]|nr:MAG: type II toxin-antitoxin system VapC family toxin [Euryarchaeota archaeon]